MREICLKSGQIMLVSDRCARRYLAGIDIAEGYLIIKDTPVYLTDARYFHQAKSKIESVGIIPMEYKGITSIEEVIKESCAKELYIDYGKTTVKEYNLYKGFNVEIKDGGKEIERACAVKTEKELADIKRACEIAEKSFYETVKNIKIGITENAVREILVENMKRLGAEGESFDTIVAFNENSAIPHHETGDSVLKENSVILIDFGCKVNGFCSDCTRTLYFGTPSDEFINVYDTVKKANEKAEREITENTACSNADKIARDYLKESGYGEKFTHSLGHGVGLEIHESPLLSFKSQDKLVNGMVFTIEPGVYLNDKFGVRIEDTVVMKDGKTERLFKDSKDLIVIK